MAAWGSDVAAAPANGAGEEGQLRRAAAGATGLEMRKKKYGVGRENETDPVVGSDKFFVRRGGCRKSEKVLLFSLSPLPLPFGFLPSPFGFWARDGYGGGLGRGGKAVELWSDGVWVRSVMVGVGL